MTATKKSWTRWLVPGFIFQSVVIGGGYGTGAEIREYFLTKGLVGGLLGCIVTLLVWSIVCAVTFEFVRVFKTYDYKSMMGKLLGKAGFLYEICYIVLLLIVMGVVNSTAGSMVKSLTGATPWIGIAILSIGVVLLVVKGTAAIEKALSFWSYVLYTVYIVFMVICFTKFGSTIGEQFSNGEVVSGWVGNGFKYSFYNLGIVPCILFAVEPCETRKEAVGQGLLCGAIAIIPAVLLLISLAGVPGALTAEVPVTAVFESLNMNWLYWAFEITLFGTLIETGTGFIKAVDDRIENTIKAKGKEVPKYARLVVAIVCAALGIGVAQFGLIGLIAKGYGTICWGFLVLFVVPMCTYGVYKIVKANKAK